MADLETQKDEVKSASRLLDILEYLAAHKEGANLTTIQQVLKIPLSSLYGILITMTKKGYAIRDDRTHQYRLGPKLHRLVGNTYGQLDLIQLADPYLNRLSRATGETTSLTILREDWIVFIHKVIGENSLQVVNPVGTTLAAHATGSGKVMLAYLSEEEVDRLYPEESLTKFTPNTITQKRNLKIALAEIIQKGFAYDNQESQWGVWAVAGCVRDHEGRPLAALSIAGFAERVQPENKRIWAHLVMEASDQLNDTLGCMQRTNRVSRPVADF